MGISATYAERILDHVLGGDAMAQPTEFHIGLFADGSEVTGGGYSRAEYTGGWTVSGRSAENSGIVDFGIPSGAWGAISQARVYDQDGVEIGRGDVPSQLTPTIGVPVVIYTGQLTIDFVEV